jgi:hypothetical protein
MDKMEVTLEVLEKDSTNQVARWAVNFLFSSSGMQAKGCLHCDPVAFLKVQKVLIIFSFLLKSV